MHVSIPQPFESSLTCPPYATHPLPISPSLSLYLSPSPVRSSGRTDFNKPLPIGADVCAHIYDGKTHLWWAFVCEHCTIPSPLASVVIMLAWFARPENERTQRPHAHAWAFSAPRWITINKVFGHFYTSAWRPYVRYLSVCVFDIITTVRMLSIAHRMQTEPNST